MKSIKAWAVLIGISFLFPNTASTEEKVVAVCNVDQLICGTINSKNIQMGILPFHLAKNNIKEVEYLDFSTVFLEDIDFDIALLPMAQAKNWLKKTDYFHYRLPIKNSLIEISLSDLGGESDLVVTPYSSCHEQTDIVNIKCVSAFKIFDTLTEGKDNIIAYQSQVNGFIPSGVHYDVIKTIRDLNYVLLINKNSSLVNLHLEQSIVHTEGFSSYQLITFILLLLLLAAGCLTGFIHANGKIDDQSGCFSKKEFEKCLKKKVQSERTVMLLDYNNFKKVNDTKGHHIGDKVIEQLSFDLINTLRNGDKIYRIGGDEFFIEFNNILPNQRAEQIKQQIQLVAEKVAKNLNLEDVNFGISIGKVNVTMGSSLKEAYKKADDAMYSEKIKGKK